MFLRPLLVPGVLAPSKEGRRIGDRLAEDENSAPLDDGLLPRGCGVGGLFIFAGAIVYLFGVFSIKTAMEEFYTSTENIGLTLSGVMTFFFSTIYLQHHINRLARWKKTGVLS